MTTVSKNFYYDVLDDIVKKYNNTWHSTIKMKPIDLKDNTYISRNKWIVLGRFGSKFPNF